MPFSYMPIETQRAYNASQYYANQALPTNTNKQNYSYQLMGWEKLGEKPVSSPGAGYSLNSYSGYAPGALPYIGPTSYTLETDTGKRVYNLAPAAAIDLYAPAPTGQSKDVNWFSGLVPQDSNSKKDMTNTAKGALAILFPDHIKDVQPGALAISNESKSYAI